MASSGGGISKDDMMTGGRGFSKMAQAWVDVIYVQALIITIITYHDS